MFSFVSRASRRLVVSAHTHNLVKRAAPQSTVSLRHFSATVDDSSSETASMPDSRFEGVGQPFDKRIAAVLGQPVPDSEIVLAKDGTLRVSDDFYKDILNKAFGVGGWALVPCGDIKDLDLSEAGKEKDFVTLIREYSLYCHERFVSQAFGETPFYPGKQYYSEATEKLKSVAISRCCKDLGIASELWNKKWTDNWKSQFAVQEWVENTTNSRKNNFWRRKDDDWSWPFQKSSAFQKTH